MSNYESRGPCPVYLQVDKNTARNSRDTAAAKIDKILFDCYIPQTTIAPILELVRDALSCDVHTSHHGLLPGVK